MLNLIREVQLDLLSPAMGIAGVYGYEVIRSDGSVKCSGEFSNLITDAGMNALGGTSISTLTSYVAVGTGTAVPSVGDTGLQTQVGTRINATGGFSEVIGYNTTTDAANPFWYRRRPRVWAKGAFGGDVNLTELGVFSAATGGVCWSRQLFRDGAGLPTTVQVLADEELKVWYEYRLYPPMTDIVQTFAIKGTSTTVTNRACRINQGEAWGSGVGQPAQLLIDFGQWVGTPPTGNMVWAGIEQALPSRTGSFSGATSAASTATWAAYVGGSYERKISVRFSPAEANFTGSKVGLIAFALTRQVSAISNCPFLTHFSPAPIKTTEEYLSLDATFSWARTPNPTI